MPSTKVRVEQDRCSDLPVPINDEKSFLVAPSACDRVDHSEFGRGRAAAALVAAAPAVALSDADLLAVTASLLDAMPGRTCGPKLSTLFEYVCSTCCPDGAADRAVRLELELAEYLNAWRVLPFAEASPAGLDVWAARAPLAFVRVALVACARCQRSGDVR